MKIIKLESVQKEELVSQALTKIKQTGLPVLVYDKKKVLGIIEELDIVNKRVSQTTKVKNLAKKIPQIEIDSTIEEIAKKFYSARSKIVLVKENEEIIGAIDRWGLISLMIEEGVLENKKVEEIMVSPIIGIDEDTKISVANSLMKQKKLRRLVVLKNSKISGIISMFDIAQTKVLDMQRKPILTNKKQKPTDLKVKDFMKKNVYVIDKDSELKSAAKRLIEQKTTNLIVIDNQLRPIGIITIRDIIKHFLKNSPKIPIIISNVQEKSYVDVIKQELDNFVQKYKKLIKINSIEVRLKKEGHSYTINAHVRSIKPLTFSATANNILQAIKKLIDEMKIVVIKEKEKRKKIKTSFED
jgi:predicted transcriptional regulator/ribosome-associated translation inhibitor RaiA